MNEGIKKKMKRTEGKKKEEKVVGREKGNIK